MDSNREQLLLECKSNITEHSELCLFKDVLDDKLLVGFLRGKRYDVKLALKCLEHYIYVRTKKYKGWTKNHPPSASTLLNKRMAHIFKQKDQKGRIVALEQVKIWEASQHSVEEAIAIIVFIIDEGIRTYLDKSVENELVIIVDCMGFCFQHARQFTPGIIIQAIELLQNSIPSRPAAIHFVNEGRLIHFVIRLIKPFLKEKIRNRIHTHSDDMSSLHQHVPPSILPKSLGGQLTDEEAFDSSLITKIKSNEEFYQKLAE